MATSETLYERYENGVVVESYMVAKPVEQFNAETVVERAEQALADNAEFIALASPTNAQAVAQVRALTRQVNGLIRLALNRFDSAD